DEFLRPGDAGGLAAVAFKLLPGQQLTVIDQLQVFQFWRQSALVRSLSANLETPIRLLATAGLFSCPELSSFFSSLARVEYA
ncbi:MAG: hypothetical protein ABW202_18310, partial [Duganella sp.]